MIHGGKRQGAGRKPGSVTKKTREAAEKAAAAGLTPLDYMLSLLRDEGQEQEKRMWAAEKAAPYVHAKLSAVELSGEVKTTHDVSDKPLSEDEWSAEAPIAH